MESENPGQCSSIGAHISEQSLCLPEEIIEEILSRLPVQSVLKFRCVSKPWRALIGNNCFVKKHLDTSTTNPNFVHHNIILNSIGPQRGLKQCSLLPMLSDPSTDQFTSCDLENVSFDSVCIVDCCNGLVCLLLDRKHFMLWNPSTRKTKKLPAFDHNNKHNLSITSYGFGYDDLSGDYLVFGVGSFFMSSGGYGAIYEVYSLQTNSWKTVKEGKIDHYFNEVKFASGKMYWRSNRGPDWNIVSFDLRSKAYGVVKLPCGHCFKAMDVLEGSLILLCDYLSRLDIWCLKEYGVNESWEKVAAVPYPHNTVKTVHKRILLTVGPNGEILLAGRSSLGMYYQEVNGLRQCHVTNFGGSCEAVLCVESLVPL